MTRLSSLLSILTISFFAQSAYALDSDFDQPLYLDGESGSYNQKAGTMTYEGNVTVTQGTIKIAADKMTAQLNKDGSIDKITTTGRPVKFQQKPKPTEGIIYGEATQVVYDAQQSLLIMTGKAKILQDGASFTGETLRYSMSKGDIEAKGGTQQRMQIIIPPNKTRVNSSVKSN